MANEVAKAAGSDSKCSGVRARPEGEGRRVPRYNENISRQVTGPGGHKRQTLSLRICVRDYEIILKRIEIASLALAMTG